MAQNLYINKTAVDGYLHAEARSISNMSSTFKEETSDWIDVQNQSVVTIQCWNSGNAGSSYPEWIGYAFYTSKDLSTAISNRTAKYSSNGGTYLAYVAVAIPSNAKYMRVSYRRLPSGGACKVEFSATPTEYSKAPEDGETFLNMTGLSYFWNKIKNYIDTKNIDASTVNGHTVNADVPANAVFTDTTYGVVSSSANGLAPATPTDTAQNTLKFLRADGTWSIPHQTTYSTMTQEQYDAGTDILGKLISPKLLHDIVAAVTPSFQFQIEALTDTYSVAANGTVTGSIDLTKSGYTPIAIAGFVSGNVNVSVARCDIWTNDNAVHYQLKNTSSSALSNTTFTAKITYVKN